MKKNKIMAFIGIVAILTTSLLTFGACKGSKPFNIDAKQIYAISAMTSVNYLLTKEQTPTSVNQMMVSDSNATQSRPADISDQDVDGMKICLTMFDSVIQGGKVDQTTVKNPMTTGEFADYNFVMNITVPGSTSVVKLYYNETETESNIEIKDEKEEVEVSTKLQGVMAVDELRFDVIGEREFEKEGDETESSISFTTKSKTNQDNYVVVEQTVEVEDGEYELKYEYEIYQGGNLIQDVETEIELENDKIELEYQLKDGQTLKETVYKISKGQDENTFVVKYLVNNNRQQINIIKTQNGYTFKYANGCVEEVTL